MAMIEQEFCNQIIKSNTTTFMYIMAGLGAIIIIMFILMLISGSWFIFGIKSKIKKAGGKNVLRIFNPDGSENWDFVSFKRPYAHSEKEKVGFIFNHKYNTRYKGVIFANFDRDLVTQKEMSGKTQEELNLSEEEIKAKNSSLWYKMAFWLKEKKIQKADKYCIIQQMNPKATPYTEIKSDDIDVVLVEAKQIVRQENQNKQFWVYFWLIVIVILVIVVIFMSVDIKNSINGLSNWIASQWDNLKVV